MSNIDKIRQEIERRKKENMHDDLPITIGRYYEDRDLLSFLDTLPEQPVEGLEEAAGLYLDNHKPLTRYNWGDLMDAFKAGAEWQKEQILQLAKNRYEVVMAFGTGNPDVDHALQMDRLALVKIIEEDKK